MRIRSTNGLERLHGEIKRRTRSVGAFPDRQSALRLVTAVALETTQVWSDRRYLDMSLLKTRRPKRPSPERSMRSPNPLRPHVASTHEKGLDRAHWTCHRAVRSNPDRS